jgi:hypothetical protein
VGTLPFPYKVGRPFARSSREEAAPTEFESYSTLWTQHRYRRNPKRGGELENPVLASPAVAAVAVRRGRSAAEVVLSWALARNMSLIPRSGNRQRVRELAANCPAVGGDAARHVVRGCLRCHSATPSSIGKGESASEATAGSPLRDPTTEARKSDATTRIEWPHL